MKGSESSCQRWNIKLLTVGFLVILVLSGCKVDSDIDIGVGGDGSGSVGVEVRLDAEAAAALPDLDQQLRVDDLREADWEVEGPKQEDGATVVSAVHKFENPDEVGALVAQMVPAGGPLQNFKVEQERSLMRVDTTFTGTADLSRGIESWGDPALRERVGTALGVDARELETNLGIDLEEMFSFAVSVDLPGEEERSPVANTDDEWELAYGTVTELRATSSTWNVKPITYFAVSLISLLGAAGVAILWRTYRPMHARRE